MRTFASPTVATGNEIVRANGVDLCVDFLGDPEARAIVLLHGAGDDMLSWDDEFCARLATWPRRIVRIDNRDSGRSVTYPPGAPPYDMADVAADVVGVLDALWIERADIVGMSQGAEVGLLLALEHADRVATLTLVSYATGRPEAILGRPAPRLPRPNWGDRGAVIDYLVEARRPYSAAFDEPRMRALAARMVDRANDIEASQTNPFLLHAGEPWRDRLDDIRAPTLVVHGAEDPRFPYANARALADAVPGAQLITLPRTGHEYFPRHTWDAMVLALLRHTV